MALPSSTAATIVEKLSSDKTISEASFATSVPNKGHYKYIFIFFFLIPVIPIATPICAYLRAGASLTPSPVIATIYFFYPSN